MITKYPNGVSSYGIPLTGNIPMVLGSTGVGNIYFVDATFGSDGNSGLSATEALATVTRAVAIAVSGDTIALSTNAAHSISTGIALTTSRVNFIGLDFGGRRLQQGARIVLATDSDSAYVLKNTGTRNSFTNIKFENSATAGTALHVVEEGGEGTAYTNCSMVFGVEDNLDETTATEFLCGSDSMTMTDCTIGNDTLATSAARAVMTIDQVTGSQPFKSNQLRRVTFSIASSDSSAVFIKAIATGDINFSNLFEDCTFIASINSTMSAAAIDAAVTTPNGLVAGTMCFSFPRCFNVTDFGTNGTNNDNLLVLGHLAVSTDIVAIAPIAT